MASYRVLKSVVLGIHHAPTGSTRHHRDGVPCLAPAQLRVAQIGAESGYYLLYLDQDGQEMTDTWHETLDGALLQAEFEFNVKRTDWSEAT